MFAHLTVWALCLSAVLAQQQCMVHVDSTLGVSAAGCGTGLGAKACKTVNEAMTAMNALTTTALTGCANVTVAFAAGNYVGAGNVDVTLTPALATNLPIQFTAPLSNPAVLDAQGAGSSSIWTINLPAATRMTLFGFTFQNGLNKANGGALNVQAAVDATLEVDTCTFLSNVAANGGAIYMGSQGTLKLNICQFIGNGATAIAHVDIESDRCVTGGGALFAQGLGPLQPLVVDIDLCQFTRNEALQACGGALLLADTPSVTVDNVGFEKNTAQDGGAIMGDSLDGATAWDDLVFASNSATDGGGALFCANCTHTISNAEATLNTASRGGALMLAFSSMTIDSVTLTSNEATYFGGGIYVFGNGDKQSANVNMFTNITYALNAFEDAAGKGANVYCSQSNAVFNPPAAAGTEWCDASCLNAQTQTCACNVCTTPSHPPHLVPPSNPATTVIIVLVVVCVVLAGVGIFVYSRKRNSRSEFLNI